MYRSRPGVAVAPNVDVVPRKAARREVAGTVPVEPLLLVENEAERSDQEQVIGDQRLECADVTADLGGDPAFAELTDLIGGG